MFALILIILAIEGISDTFWGPGKWESRSDKKARLEMEEFNKNLAIQRIANRLDDIASQDTKLKFKKRVIPQNPRFHKTYDN